MSPPPDAPRRRKKARALSPDARDHDRAARRFEEGIALFRTVDDARGLSVVLHNLGLVVLGTGDTGRTIELLEEARVLDARAGDHAHLANVLRALARALVAQGQPDRGIEMLRESLALLRTLDEPGGMAELLEILAAALALRGDGLAAARLPAAPRRCARRSAPRASPTPRSGSASRWSRCGTTLARARSTPS